MDLVEKVTQAFYNPSTGLTRNIAKLKAKNPELWGIPAKTIRGILDQNIALYNRNNGRGIHAKERIRYRADYVGQLLQADLAFVASPRNTTQSIKIKGEDGSTNHYVLIIVDTYSRYIWAYPLETKSAVEVTRLIGDTIAFIREFFYGGFSGLRFTVHTDGGTEFSTAGIEESENVVHTIAKEHASLAEAAIYRLRTKLKYLDRGEGPKRKLDNATFVNLIQNLNLDSNADAIFEKEALAEDPPEIEPPSTPPEYSQGDYVRVKRRNELFEKKSSLSTFSERVFTVGDVLWFPLDRVWVYKIVTPDGVWVSTKNWFSSDLGRVSFTLAAQSNLQEHVTKQDQKDFFLVA